MDTPRIQYAKTSDGVSIAYMVIGEGPWLVYASNVWGDVHWYMHNDETRRSVDGLASNGWRLLRYDGRGMGASDRDVTDFSLGARLRDLEAVVDHVGIDGCALCGYGQGGPVAIAYSLGHPERVSHLAMINSFASGAAYYEKIAAMRALISMRSMAREQWEFFTTTLASAATGFQDTARAAKTAKLFRSSMSPDAFLSFVEASRKIDVMELLPQLRVPTLVVQDSSGFATEDLSRVLASRIPHASFVSTDDYTGELDAFVRGRRIRKVVSARPTHVPSSTAVILFADIADSTALTERLGDAAFRERSRQLEERLLAVVRECGGSAVEGRTLGDGVLATFASAREAIEAGSKCAWAGDDIGLGLHVGIHAGDVIREEGNVYGGAVNIAARISDASAPGEVLVSDVVRGLARTSAGVGFEDRGEREMKGVGEKMRVWAVVAEEAGSGKQGSG